MEKSGMRRRASVVLAALVLLVAACGPDESAGVEAEAPASEQGPADESAEVDAEPSADGAAENADSEAATSPGDLDDFCVAAQNVEDTLDSLGLGTPPNELEATLNEAQAAMGVAIETAPDEIVEDVKKSSEAFGVLKAEIERVEFNMLDLDPSALNAIDADPTFAASDENLDAYLFENCDIGGDPALVDEQTDTSFAEGTIREQVIASLSELGFTEAEADCIVDNADLGDPAILQDQAALLGVLTACGIPPERLAQLGGN